MDYVAQAYQGGLQGQSLGAVNKAVEAPRTISSAASRIDSLNERLAKANEALSMISQQIGAVFPVATPRPASGNETCAASGAVYRLNDATDVAHGRLSDIENLIGAIGRALG